MSLFGDDMPATTPDPAAGSMDDEAHGAGAVLSSPRTMPFCLGHTAQEKQCLNMLISGKMPHALMLTGLKGIGKATFAHRLAKYLLAHADLQHDPNQNALFDGNETPSNMPLNLDTPAGHQAVRLYLNGAHPDCKTVERAYDDAKNKYKDAVDVAEIRKIAPFLRMSASDGGWRIVIVDDADTMNRSAQNALLKVLEEPPKKTLIMLVAHRPGRLIATIHSRVQRLNFTPLVDADIAHLLSMAEDKPDADQMTALVSMAQGSVGNALTFWEQGGIESLSAALEILQAYPRFDWSSLHKKIDPMTRAGQDQTYRLFQTLLCRIFFDLTSVKARNKPLPHYLADHKFAAKMLDDRTIKDLAHLSSALQEHFDKSNFANLDKKQTLLHAISLIAA